MKSVCNIIHRMRNSIEFTRSARTKQEQTDAAFFWHHCNSCWHRWNEVQTTISQFLTIRSLKWSTNNYLSVSYTSFCMNDKKYNKNNINNGNLQTKTGQIFKHHWIQWCPIYNTVKELLLDTLVGIDASTSIWRQNNRLKNGVLADCIFWGRVLQSVLLYTGRVTHIYSV